MAFSQTTILDVQVCVDGPDLFVSWTTEAPWGTPFQVYVDRRLAWHGRQRFCSTPIPPNAARRNVWIEVCSVDSDELTEDYSANLSGPGGSGSRAKLTWYGGSYLDSAGLDDVSGYHVYQSSAPGAAVDFGTSVASLPAYPAGIVTDGFGLGQFGRGGFGRAATLYEWCSAPLSSGVWQFAVVPYDTAGNSQAVVQTISLTVATPPRPPAANSAGSRLTYSYSGPGQGVATLTWLPSPS